MEDKTCSLSSEQILDLLTLEYQKCTHKDDSKVLCPFYIFFDSESTLCNDSYDSMCISQNDGETVEADQESISIQKEICDLEFLGSRREDIYLHAMDEINLTLIGSDMHYNENMNENLVSSPNGDVEEMQNVSYLFVLNNVDMRELSDLCEKHSNVEMSDIDDHDCFSSRAHESCVSWLHKWPHNDYNFFVQINLSYMMNNKCFHLSN